MASFSLIFIWLDKRIGNIPGANQTLKENFRKLLSPIRQFDKPSSCLDATEFSLKDKRIFFITSNSFADHEFLKKLASLSNVYHIYIYNQEGKDYQINDSNLNKKMGLDRIIQFDEQLYKQIVIDLIQMYSNDSSQLANVQQAKQSLEYALKLLNTIDDKDEDLQQMENYLLSRINCLK